MNLTDDWRAGRLKTGFYYVKLLKESAVIPFLYIEHTKEWEDLHESRIEEVLAPCDYEELQDLKESCNQLKHSLDFSIKTNEKALQENTNLRKLVGEYKYAIEDLQSLGRESVNEIPLDTLLTHINEVLK